MHQNVFGSPSLFMTDHLDGIWKGIKAEKREGSEFSGAKISKKKRDEQMNAKSYKVNAQ